MACSMPPMYWSTGIQRAAAALSMGLSVVPRIAEALEVPRRVHEGVHGVGLALGRPAADGAGGVQEALVVAQRRLAGRAELHVVGQQDRQLVLRAPGRSRDPGSAPPGSGSPSTAGGTAASPAGGS